MVNPLAKMLAAKREASAEGAAQVESPKAPTVAPVEAPKSSLAARFTKPAVQVAAKPESTGPDDMDLSDLENLELDDESTPLVRSTKSQFDDETPATAPVRELPEGLEKQQLQFVDLMDGIYSVLDDPALLGNVIKSIMIELQANPQYMQLVVKEDIRTWVQSMRKSMGLAVIKKQETASKKGKGAASKSTKVDADMASDLDDLLNGVL